MASKELHQGSKENQKLFRYRDENGKLGFVNWNNQIVIPAQWQEVWNFPDDDDLAVVKSDENGKYGYIDKTGKCVIPCIWDECRTFSDGMAFAHKDGKCWYINKSGEAVIPIIWDKCDPFSEELAYVMEDEKYGYINKSGEVVLPLIWDGCGRFSDGLASVLKDGKYGYINKSGEVVLPLIWDRADDFYKGVATVFEGDKLRYIDKNGNILMKKEESNLKFWNDIVKYINDKTNGAWESKEKKEFGDYFGCIGFYLGDWCVHCDRNSIQLNNRGIKLAAKGSEGLEKIIFDTEKKTVSVVVKNPKLPPRVPRTADLSDAPEFFEELRKDIETMLVRAGSSIAPNEDRTVFEISYD